MFRLLALVCSIPIAIGLNVANVPSVTRVFFDTVTAQTPCFRRPDSSGRPFVLDAERVENE